jgi:hypothetical protein
MRSINRFFVTVTIAAATAPNVAAQETQGWRWSVAGGPTVALSNGHFFQPGSDGTRFISSEPIITGGEHGIFHFALGASRRIPGSSLLFRGELLYNSSESAPRPWLAASRPLWYPRPALRDEAYLIGTGLEWDALPTKPWSPYLLTTLGLMHSRLGWNRDASSNRVNETTVSQGLFAGYGAGLRIRVGQREYFTEWRRIYTTYSTYGSSVAPLSLGVRF